MHQQEVFERKLADYFKGRLEEVCTGDFNATEDTTWYIGSLLARFGDSRQLFSYDGDVVDIRSLALLYKDACETHNARERCLILRQLGDLSLFLGALFPENYARRGIRLDYFIGMGGSAYDYLSEQSDHGKHVFSELAGAFAKFIELVAEVCSSQTCFDQQDIIALYERWRQTGNPLIARQLQALGFNDLEAPQLH